MFKSGRNSNWMKAWPPRNNESYFSINMAASVLTAVVSWQKAGTLMNSNPSDEIKHGIVKSANGSTMAPVNTQNDSTLTTRCPPALAVTSTNTPCRWRNLNDKPNHPSGCLFLYGQTRQLWGLEDLFRYDTTLSDLFFTITIPPTRFRKLNRWK